MITWLVYTHDGSGILSGMCCVGGSERTTHAFQNMHHHICTVCPWTLPMKSQCWHCHGRLGQEFECWSKLPSLSWIGQDKFSSYSPTVGLL